MPEGIKYRQALDAAGVVDRKIRGKIFFTIVQRKHPDIISYLRRGDIIENTSTNAYYFFDGKGVIFATGRPEALYGVPDVFPVFKEFTPDYWNLPLNENRMYSRYNQKSTLSWAWETPDIYLDINALRDLIKKGYQVEKGFVITFNDMNMSFILKDKFVTDFKDDTAYVNTAELLVPHI
jgi:hypothetical protein